MMSMRGILNRARAFAGGVREGIASYLAERADLATMERHTFRPLPSEPDDLRCQADGAQWPCSEWAKAFDRFSRRALARGE